MALSRSLFSLLFMLFFKALLVIVNIISGGEYYAFLDWRNSEKLLKTHKVCHCPGMARYIGTTAPFFLWGGITPELIEPHPQTIVICHRHLSDRKTHDEALPCDPPPLRYRRHQIPGDPGQARQNGTISPTVTWSTARHLLGSRVCNAFLSEVDHRSCVRRLLSINGVQSPFFRKYCALSPQCVSLTGTAIDF
ncbi:hypothetical protein J3A83DRAFT_2954122 [Scleroderma citrinum]